MMKEKAFKDLLKERKKGEREVYCSWQQLNCIYVKLLRRFPSMLLSSSKGESLTFNLSALPLSQLPSSFVAFIMVKTNFPFKVSSKKKVISSELSS